MTKMLEGKVAIVTGGSRGIGKAIVEMLTDEGCQVAFNYLQSKKSADDLLKAVSRKGIRCSTKCVDIKDYEAVNNWILDVKKQFGRLDILINNAGIIRDKALMMMTKEDWNEVIDTNLTGVFNATRACIVTFLKQRSGHIINISSVSGVSGIARQTNYSASKGGVNTFTKALAKEVANYGVRVNALTPGFIETDILASLSEEQKKNILDQIPLGRLGSVKDVARAVRFLLSEDAQYITGQLIQIDGGLAIR